jgi:hypothetical protein
MHCAPIKTQKQLCIVTFTEEPLAIDIWTRTDECNAPLLMLTREKGPSLCRMYLRRITRINSKASKWQRARGEALCKVF